MKFDFRKVISMQPYGGELVSIHGTETEKIPVALRIGFKTKEEIETVPIYVEDEDDIKRAPIYKVFETLWKYYHQTKIDQRKLDEINERLKIKKCRMA
ncbi:hypothetical protein FNJ88_08755 [Chryseobacterium sp. SNU WT5]|uniref:hypothetical protein n=1 Tax=Chryseobacterium sp. SNU WT5 TaxID=2594269 RepID=UPI00117C7302|nr:hypothetical protein [Chryseobacterium sp. SNU WT5]QDP85642.1 hypothetical protein FNJ88_08755 [Chryseobacterium sp. SNU WT5]